MATRLDDVRRLAPLLALLIVTPRLGWAEPSGELPGASPHRVQGVVEGPTGAPVAEAQIRIFAARSRWEASGERLESDAERPPPVARGRSDAEGRFTVEVQRSGVFEVVVEAPGSMRMSWSPLPVIRSVALPPLVLSNAREARVRLVGPDGSALEGWRVLARAVPGRVPPVGWRRALQRSRTDSDGSVVLSRVPGEELEIIALGDSLVTRRLSAFDRDLVIAVPSAVARRGLELRNAKSEPLEGCLVGIWNWSESVGRTDAAGRIPLPGLEVDREWALEIVTPEGAALRRTVSFDRDGRGTRSMVLSEPGSASGRVLDVESGVPVEGALAWIAADPGRYALSGPDGRFDLGACDGRCLLEVQAARFEPRLGRLREPEQGAVVDVPLRRATALAGVVIDAEGSPVPAAYVSASPSGPRRGPQPSAAHMGALSDAAGAFVLHGSRSGASLRIRAEHRQAGRAELDWLVRADSGPRLRLALPASVAGRLLNDEGIGIEGARVHVTAPETMGPSGRETTTSRDGSFLLERLSGGLSEIQIRHQAYAPLDLRQVELAAGERRDLGDLVLRRGALLAATVIDSERRPIARARVRLFVRGPGADVTLLRELETAEDGAFSIANLNDGVLVHLWVQKDGFLDSRLSSVRPGGELFEIAMERAATVTGRVASGDGMPIAGAQIRGVHAQPLPETSGRAFGPPRGLQGATTRGGGEFILNGLPPGRLEIWAEARGFVDSERLTLAIEEGRTVDAVDFDLETGATLKGEVVDSEGNPVPSSRVLSGDEGDLTDEKGRYRLSGIPLGEQRVVADHPNYARVSESIEIGEGENILPLTFSAGETVRGHAWDDEGRPLAGAAIVLQAPGQGGAQYGTTTGEDGAFSFPAVASGRYELKGERAGFADVASASPVIVPGPDNAELELVFDRGTTVSGYVLGLDPSEMSRVRVEAIDLDGGIRRGLPGFDGAYRLDNLKAGRWLVRASLHQGGRQARGRLLVEESDREVELDLEFARGLTLSGVVLHDGEQLAGALVTLKGEQLAVDRLVVTDQEGGFQMTDLDPGAYLLSLVQARERLVHNERLLLERDREITVALDTGSLSGRVVEAGSGEPLGGGLLSLRRVVTVRKDFSSLVTQGSDADGSFFFARLPPGRYSLEVVRGGYASHAEEIVISPGEDLADLQVDLEPTEGLSLRISAHGALPISADVLLTNLDTGRELHRMCAVDEEGLCDLPTVPAGEWLAALGAAGASETTLRLRAPAEAVPVTLQPGAQIRVIVRALELSDQLGLAVVRGFDGTRLTTIAQGGRRQDTWTALTGIASIGGVPPGEWTVEVTAADGRRWEGTVVVHGEAVAELNLD